MSYTKTGLIVSQIIVPILNLMIYQVFQDMIDGADILLAIINKTIFHFQQKNMPLIDVTNPGIE